MPPRTFLPIQSHRGAGDLSTDNTLEAFELGWSLGTIPEADIRTSRDGVLLAFHDHNLERTVTLSNPDPEFLKKFPGQLTWRELQHLDVGSWKDPRFSHHRIPRIADVFARMKEHPERELYLDIKEVSLAALSSVVDEFSVGPQVILASTDYQLLQQWKSLRPEDGRTLCWMGTWGGLGEDYLAERFAQMRKLDYRAISQVQIHAHTRIPHAEIRRDSVDPFIPSDTFFRAVSEELSARGILLQSLPWNGSSAEIYWKLMDLGVQSFATDHPKITLEAVRQWM